MAAAESWPKSLRCPLCGAEGVAWLSHVEDPSDESEIKTIVDTCPAGFRAEKDEDDSNIFRFYCAADNRSADQ